MKKNLFNGLLVLAVASVGAGTFSSCKDDNGDELSIVQSQVSALEAEIENLKACKCLCQDKWDELKTKLTEELNKLKNTDASQDSEIATLKDRITNLEGTMVNVQTIINNLDNRIVEIESFMSKYENFDPSEVNKFMEIHSLATNELITELQNTITELQNNQNNFVNKTDFNELKNVVNNLQNDLNTKYTELDKKAEDGVKAWAWIELNEGRISVLESTAADYKEFKEQHAQDIKKLQDQINVLATDIENNNTLIQALQGDVNTIKENIANLENKFASLEARVAANEAAINELKNDINKLFNLADRLNKLVTGIINQATTNPVLGYFNLPVNVRSNMLLTYYGSASHNYTFPSYSSSTEYNGELVFTQKDIEMLNASGNFQTFSMTEGDVLMDQEDGNAGMVFLTINPNNVDFTGMNLPLVNSQDQESGMKLKNLKRSDKVLNFGYTRAANNGFYEAQATVDPNHVDEISIKIEPGLKSAFKDALNNRGKKDFAQLAKVLYNQFSDILPANGLKAAWTAPDENGNMKDYAVYSNYDIAATALTPLSFKFMEGESIEHKLPTFTPISGFEFDKSKFTFDIDVPKFVINDVELNFKLDDVHLSEAGDIWIEIEVPELDEDGNLTGKTEIKKYNLKDDINEVLKQVEADVNATIGDWNENIENEFKDALTKLTDDIETQVDKMMNDVMGQIDSNLDKLIDEINKEVDDALGGYISKANKVIEKYNKLANKLNSMLDNPNYYLQSLACYQGTDGDFHQLSNAIDMPSPFKLAGGNAITIYLTSFNAEIVVPSFKKFVAVTNVWNEATGKSAQEGDAEAKQLLIEANSQEHMNQPISGKQHRIAFAANKAGFKYEIVYSALDYRGWTSSRKYYVSVK